jgi:hypothetical protein
MTNQTTALTRSEYVTDNYSTGLILDENDPRDAALMHAQGALFDQTCRLEWAVRRIAELEIENAELRRNWMTAVSGVVTALDRRDILRNGFNAAQLRANWFQNRMHMWYDEFVTMRRLYLLTCIIAALLIIALGLNARAANEENAALAQLNANLNAEVIQHRTHPQIKEVKIYQPYVLVPRWIGEVSLPTNIEADLYAYEGGLTFSGMNVDVAYYFKHANNVRVSDCDGNSVLEIGAVYKITNIIWTWDSVAQRHFIESVDFQAVGCVPAS